MKTTRPLRIARWRLSLAVWGLWLACCGTVPVEACRRFWSDD